MNFQSFKQAVAKQFQRLSTHKLLTTNISKDDLWTTYLNSFPTGTNPIFRVRTEHDCGCCKQFIRNLGNVVAIIDGKIETIWDITVPGYQPVADALAKLVKSQPIDSIYLHYERSVGTDKNFEEMLDKTIKTWDHFHVNLPTQVVVSKHSIPTQLGNVRTTHGVFVRALKEITSDALDTVLELIDQNSLYRGAEHKFAVGEFKKRHDWAKNVADINIYAWNEVFSIPESVSRIRNTSIGTLLVELSEGMALEDAVKRFEAMVAPANYKRPTALVTKAMIEKAKATINDLGLTSALERRYAKLDDITVNNILFADRNTKKTLTGDVFDDLSAKADKPKSLDKVEEVSIQNFLDNILPKAKTLEIMVENHHINNFVSLITAADPTAQRLFKWDNNFSWSYNGDYADSIKERVKQAGGNVTGDLCCRLAWYNADDLDLHMYEPGGYRIYYGNKRKLSQNGGMLDVDANGGDGLRENPVENIFYAKESTMLAGTYKLVVHNFNRRRNDNVGFEAEIDYKGNVYRFAYDKMVPDGRTITIAEFKYHPKTGIEIIDGLPSTNARVSKEVWGLSTNTFVPVKVAMMSPNFWDDKAVGNKHYFFMLDGCKNDGTARGFFNEFLVDSLNPHRKVIEMVGSKMRTDESEHQLSGLGFSSTQRNSVIARVTGAFTRVIKIVF